MTDINLAYHPHAQRRSTPKGAQTWVEFTGPRGGKGWKHVNTGQIIYGGAKPGEYDTDVHKRLEESRQRRLKERKERGPPDPSEHSAAMQGIPDPSDQVKAAARQAFWAIYKAHGEGSGHRVGEIIGLITEAMKNTMDPELKRRLMLKAMAAKGMLQASQETGSTEPGGSVKDQGERKVPAGAPPKPQSPYLPKRGTS